MRLEPPPAYLPDCVFCRIGQDEELPAGGASSIVYSDRYVKAFEPLNPVTPGHLLVIPRFHIENAADLVNEPWGMTCKSRVWDIACHLAARLEASNLITSSGEAATQSVFHLHVHVVPRRHGDGLHLPWTAQRTGDGE